MSLLFLFLDGVGLGAEDPAINPFARTDMPALQGLLGGHRLTLRTAPWVGEKASLLALDAGLGVDGLPQSATGQAVLLTGRNVPRELGYHYGPKPNQAVAQILSGATVFSKAVRAGMSAALLNAYPSRYFHGIDSGKRLYSSFPLAVTNAGIRLFTRDDLHAGRALAADFTGHGWRRVLRDRSAPVMDEHAAGHRLAQVAAQHDLSLFEYWASDYAGHKQDMQEAVNLLQSFDKVLGGLLETWPLEEAFILITSDHGNMEDLSTRRHTLAPVPALLIGPRQARDIFSDGLTDLTGIEPAMWHYLSTHPPEHTTL